MEELTIQGDYATVTQDLTDAQGAASSDAEDTQRDTGYLSIIKEQQATIASLQEQLQKANSSLATAIRQGAAFVAQPEKTPEPEPMEDYTFLKDLDFNIDKSDYLKG